MRYLLAMVLLASCGNAYGDTPDVGLGSYCNPQRGNADCLQMAGVVCVQTAPAYAGGELTHGTCMGTTAAVCGAGTTGGTHCVAACVRFGNYPDGGESGCPARSTCEWPRMQGTDGGTDYGGGPLYIKAVPGPSFCVFVLPQ